MLAVGAAPWYNARTIEDYSSGGPTPDDRVKPDIVGAACGETALQPLNTRRQGFCGTSQSAPHVAGMAALARQRFPEFTPVQAANYLRGNAEQRDALDPNNTWGHGFALLPPGCFQSLGPLTAAISLSGTWNDDCVLSSSNTGSTYASYYSFRLTQEMDIKIDLASNQSRWLLPMHGAGTNGEEVEGLEQIVMGDPGSPIDRLQGIWRQEPTQLWPPA